MSRYSLFQIEVINEKHFFPGQVNLYTSAKIHFKYVVDKLRWRLLQRL